MCFFNSRAPASHLPQHQHQHSGYMLPTVLLYCKTNTTHRHLKVAWQPKKAHAMNRAKGTSQLRVDLDPTLANVGKQTGLQINK